jgi:hypothetical protein
MKILAMTKGGWREGGLLAIWQTAEPKSRWGNGPGPCCQVSRLLATARCGGALARGLLGSGAVVPQSDGA